tara:strand:- start:1080 stop:2153 length:1074 start_codon:yes stop_codon:yes gene_type:complete
MNTKNQNINYTKKIFSPFEVDEKKILDFYSKAFPKRTCRLENLWKWFYRTDFFTTKKHPVIAMSEKQEKVVGHMAIIPFWLFLKEKKTLASWYTDMYVDPEFRGKGIAKAITYDLMKLTYIHFGFVGNDQSMGVFKNFNWIDGYEGYLHHFTFQPMNYSKFSKYSKKLKWIYYLINFVFKNISRTFYKFKKKDNNTLSIQSLDEENIKTFIDVENVENLIKPIRDKEYLHWRFLNSPEKEKYKIFKENNNIAALIKERKDKENSWHLDILLINNFSESNKIISFLAKINLWAEKNNFAYVRMYVSNKNLSNKIKHNLLSITRSPRFFYYTKNKSYMDALKKCNFFWQLADSDFEIIL